MNGYFDIALNLASDRFLGDRKKVITNAISHDVNYFNIVCSSIAVSYTHLRAHET